MGTVRTIRDVKHADKKKKEYLKDRIKELAMKGKNNIRDMYRVINELKRSCQPRNIFVKDEIGGLLADSHSIFYRWKNYFSQLLNVHNVSGVRQIEVHTAEPLVPGPSRLEVQIAIAKFKTYKSPGSDQIAAELMQEGGGISPPAIRKLVNSVWNKEELPISGRSLLNHFTKRVKLTVIIIVGYHCYQLHARFYRISSSQS
jgi:hypothetical protein